MSDRGDLCTVFDDMDDVFARCMQYEPQSDWKEQRTFAYSKGYNVLNEREKGCLITLHGQPASNARFLFPQMAWCFAAKLARKEDGK